MGNSASAPFYTLFVGTDPVGISLLKTFVLSLLRFDSAREVYIVTDVPDHVLREGLPQDLLGNLKLFDFAELDSRVLPTSIYHDGINHERFEMLCFRRFILMGVLMDRVGADSMVHLDADLFHTSDVFDLVQMDNGPWVAAPGKGATFVSMWSREGIRVFTDKLSDYVEDCHKLKPRRSSDMHYMQWLIGRSLVRHQDIGDLRTSLRIGTFRSFLFDRIPPCCPIPEDVLQVFRTTNKFGLEEQKKYYPVEHVSKFITYSPESRSFMYDPEPGTNGKKRRPIEYVHLQGSGTKKHFHSYFFNIISNLGTER